MRGIAVLLACLLLLTLAPAGAESAYTGQSLTTFVSYYSDDVYFINDNTGYHLLPLIITQQKSGANDGRVVFTLTSEALTLYGTTGRDGDTIDRCAITLTAPSGMEVGNALYNDFVTTAYHCYALLMAMEGSAQAAERYAVVDLIEQAVADGDGTGTISRGVYTLTGERAGSAIALTFVNTRAIPDPTDAPTDESAPDESPAPENGTDEAGTGMM